MMLIKVSDYFFSEINEIIFIKILFFVVEWKNETSTISDSGDYQLTKVSARSHKLNISAVRAIHQGQYRVILTNKNGSTTLRFALNVVSE